ncbi:MAG: hypothetical protein ABWK01_07445 [Infirmifilum sp.]
MKVAEVAGGLSRKSEAPYLITLALAVVATMCLVFTAAALISLAAPPSLSHFSILREVSTFQGPPDPSLIRGEVGLEAGFKDVPDTEYELIDVSKIPREVLDLAGVGPGYEPVFSVAGRQSHALYVVLKNDESAKHLVFYAGAKGVRVEELEFSEVSEERVERDGPVQRLVVDGREVEVRGRLACGVKKSTARYGTLQVSSIYFDCWYTTYLGSTQLATTHSRGYVYYIPGQVVTSFTDLSYYTVHNPLVESCWFRSYPSGVGQPVGSLTAEGKFLTCFVAASTQWTQFARFVVDARTGGYWCEGAHNAWASPGCNC